MLISRIAVAALFGLASAKKSTTKQRRAFLNEMKSANLNLHPSERSLTKDQTPSLETFSEIINGDSPRSENYRNKIIKKAKFISPEEIQARESGRRLDQNVNYANGQYNYNNGQGVQSLYSSDANGDAYIASGTFNNAFGFDPSDYSFSYLRCAEVRQFNDDLASQEDSPSVFSTRHFAVFRFCPTTTCEGMTEKQIENERQQENSAWAAEQNQAYADNQAAAYAQARSGDVYSAYQAQMYVKQQAAAAQAAGEDYEPPSWVFDKRIIGGADGSGCSSNYGEYMLELEDYLQIMLEYHQDRFEVYCEYCDQCMYQVYQSWLNSNQRDLQAKTIDQDWKEDMERHLTSEEIRKLGNVYGTCPEYDTCKYYQKTCGNDLDDALTQYFECTQVERNNGMTAFIGPHCGQDGKTVTLGLYSDEECNEYIGDSTNINNFLGFTLEEGALDGYVSGSLARDVIPDDYFEQYWSEELQAYYNPQEQMCIPCSASLQIYNQKGNIKSDDADDDYLTTNNMYDDEVTDLCTNMYLASARCDKHYKSYSGTNKNAKLSNYYSQQDLSCDFISSVVEGNYNEMGFVNLPNENSTLQTGNILTNSIYYEEYGHYIQEVSPLQIFGLCASIGACCLLALWAGALGRQASNSKAPWRPRRGRNVSSSAVPAARQDSGIAMNRSATMERGRSTSSYYMT